MLSRAKNVGDVFFETQCSSTHSHVCNNAIEHHNVQQSVTVNTWKSGVFSIWLRPQNHLMVGVGCPMTRHSKRTSSPSVPSMSLSSCVNLGGTSPVAEIDASLTSPSADRPSTVDQVQVNTWIYTPLYISVIYISHCRVSKALRYGRCVTRDHTVLHRRNNRRDRGRLVPLNF